MSAGYLAADNCPRCVKQTRLRYEYGQAGDMLCVVCGIRVYDTPPARLIQPDIPFGTPGSEIVRDRMEGLQVGGAVEVPLIAWVEPITLRSAAKKQAAKSGMQVLLENFEDAFLIHRLR